jgi:CheY-like chemotaxis protein
MAKITPFNLEFDAARRAMDLDVQKGKPRKFILAIDDVMSFLDTIAAVLGNDYDVGVAQDLVQAIKILKRRQVDLLFLDQGMHDMLGTEFLARLRKLPNLAEMPVVIISATVTQELLVRARTLGVKKVLAKPVGADDLRKVAKLYLS